MCMCMYNTKQCFWNFGLQVMQVTNTSTAAECTFQGMNGTSGHHNANKPFPYKWTVQRSWLHDNHVGTHQKESAISYYLAVCQKHTVVNNIIILILMELKYQAVPCLLILSLTIGRRISGSCGDLHIHVVLTSSESCVLLKITLLMMPLSDFINWVWWLPDRMCCSSQWRSMY